jgi:tRNA pseudouridine38-40 synthase
MPTPQTIKLTLAYDGTDFHGWQVQPQLPSIQGELARALHYVTGEQILPQASGRTDAGVHALAQVVSFSLNTPIPIENLQRALNRSLPPAIRVLAAQVVQKDFHARYGAKEKSYEYRIFNRFQDPNALTESVCPPMLARYAWNCPWRLDLAQLNEAAAFVLGEHDFTSFAAVDPEKHTQQSSDSSSQIGSDSSSQIAKTVISTDPDIKKNVIPTEAQRSGGTCVSNTADSTAATTEAPKGNIRTILSSIWTAETSIAAGGTAPGALPPLLIYRVRGTGFLHHMVRNLVGSFVDAACGRITPADIPRILAAKNRSAAGATAPANGLFLVSVEYPPA